MLGSALARCRRAVAARGRAIAKFGLIQIIREPVASQTLLSALVLEVRFSARSDP